MPSDLSGFEGNELCDSMIEVELLLKYQNFAEASSRLEKILLEHPDYLPAKEAMLEICQRTGMHKRSQDLEREIQALSEQRAKEQLSPSAREEFGKIEKRQFAEKVDRLIKIIYQSQNLDETLNNSATELQELLKADRCLILLFGATGSTQDHFEYCAGEVSKCLDERMIAFLLSWFSQNLGIDSPIICRNPQLDSSLMEYRQLLEDHQIHAMMAYPLIYKSGTLGWLVIQQCVPYYRWVDGDITLFSTACGHLATAIQNLQSMNALQDLVNKDNLTGLYNRHFLQERLTVELNNARRLKEPLSLAIIDIDHFKSINDTYGHLAGDTVLRKLGFFLKTNVRKGSVVARWVGEEFLCVFPAMKLGTAAMIMERFRKRVSQTIAIQGQPVTISIGLAQAKLDSPLSLEQIQTQLIGEADACLYAAKKNGRNQIKCNVPTQPNEESAKKGPAEPHCSLSYEPEPVSSSPVTGIF